MVQYLASFLVAILTLQRRKTVLKLIDANRNKQFNIEAHINAMERAHMTHVEASAMRLSRDTMQDLVDEDVLEEMHTAIAVSAFTACYMWCVF